MTSIETVTIERYQAGARWGQCLVGGGLLLAGMIFTVIGYFREESACYLAWIGLGPFIGLMVVFFLRRVTFHLDPSTRQVQREARWAGVLLSSVTIEAKEYSAIRLGCFDGGREGLPIYWAQLIGPVNYTLVESIRRDEVSETAQLAGEMLGLQVQ